MNDAALAAIIGAAVVAVTSGVFSFLTLWLNKRSEERRQLRDLVFKAAFEEWNLINARIRAEHPGASPLPLETYIIRASILIRQIDHADSIDPAKVGARVRSTLEAQHAAEKEAEKFYRERR